MQRKAMRKMIKQEMCRWIEDILKKSVGELSLDEVIVKLRAFSSLKEKLEGELNKAANGLRDAMSVEANVVRTPSERRISLIRGVIFAKRIGLINAYNGASNFLIGVIEKVKIIKTLYDGMSEVEKQSQKDRNVGTIIKCIYNWEGNEHDFLSCLWENSMRGGNSMDTCDADRMSMLDVSLVMDDAAADLDKLTDELIALYDEYDTISAKNDPKAAAEVCAKIKLKTVEMCDKMGVSQEMLSMAMPGDFPCGHNEP